MSELTSRSRIRGQRVVAIVVLTLTSVLLISCGGGGSGGTSAKQLLSISVTPSTSNVPNGLTQQFTATGIFSDTSTADLTNSVSWSSGTPTIATVSATSGLARAVAVGSDVITARFGSLAGSATLNVTAAILESVSITPNPALAGVGIATQFTATGTYSGGTTANVTSAAIWSSSAPTIATIGPTTGLADGVSLGSATISATVGLLTKAASLTVVTNAWGPAASMSVFRFGHTATLLPNGRVLVAGGGTDLPRGITSSAELYDPSSNAWLTASSMSNTRTRHTATLLPNGKVLAAGGQEGCTACAAPPAADAELYDPVANTWSAAASMSTAREGHTATLLPNGKVLVAGGHIDNTTNTNTSSAELFDPVSNTWSSAGTMSAAREGHTATLLPNGKVLVAGGADATADLYDPVGNTWSPGGSMSTARAAHTATLLPNGKVLTAGGFDSSGVTASAEVYDPVANTWAAAGSMSTARSDHTATLLPNGKVLAAGGSTTAGSAGAASAELYDAVADLWSPAGNMLHPHSSPTATLIPSGPVLVASAGTAELYYP